MKHLLSSLLIYVFLAISFIGFILIYVGFGARGRYKPPGETNYYFVVLGLVLLLPFLIYLLRIFFRNKKSEDIESRRIQGLLATGYTVEVALNIDEIKTNSYLQEITVGSGTRERLETVQVHHNVIKLKVPYKDDLIKYKLNIDMDPSKLKMHFALQKKTKMYVDPENPKNNYLDLRFLEN